MFKRLVTHTCTGTNPIFCKKNSATGKMPTVADVHKAGYCIKCNYKPFPHRFAKYTKLKHRKNFVNKCLPRAIDKAGKIKKEFRCTGQDMEYAKAAIAGF